MTFKDSLAKFEYEVLAKHIKLNQKEAPSNDYAGSHLRKYIVGMQTGALRQRLMKEFFKQKSTRGKSGYIHLVVNRKRCFLTKDKDLQALIKSGFLVMVREINWGKRNRVSMLTWSGKDV